MNSTYNTHIKTYINVCNDVKSIQEMLEKFTELLFCAWAFIQNSCAQYII